MMRRLAILLLVCGGLGFVLEREQRRGTFDRWERWAVDELQRVFGGQSPAIAPVVLIELRQGDLPFESWPPAPLDYALVFENLVRREPREVVVQPLLAWPGVEALDSATLAERIALLPRGVFACSLQRATDGAVGDPATVLPLSRLTDASGPLAEVPEFSGPGQWPIDELRGGKALGFTRIEFGDGVVAEAGSVRVPLVARRGNELFPSLVLQALLSWHATPPQAVGIQLGRRLVVASGLEVPVDRSGRQRVSTRLAPPLRRLDAGALMVDLERDASLMAERPAELAALQALEGALVVVGETGESTPRFAVGHSPDQHWTEAEVIAQSLAAALTGFHLREPAVAWQWAGWAGVVVLGAALLAVPRQWVAVFMMGGSVALGLSMALAFVWRQWWVPPIPPLALWAGACLIAGLLPPPVHPPAPDANLPPAAVLPPPEPPGVQKVPEELATTEPSKPADPDAAPARLTPDGEDTALAEMASQLAEDEGNGNGTDGSNVKHEESPIPAGAEEPHSSHSSHSPSPPPAAPERPRRGRRHASE
ncbi:MAG: CHASE2 domain-containing protein [Verrucomicrobiales bacterium]